MRKLFLSITLFFMFILMFAVTMIPIQANSYQGITLDTPIEALNFYTLRQVFQDNNEFINGSFDNGLNNWFTVANQDTEISVVDGELQVLSIAPVASSLYIYQYINFIQNNQYYLRFDHDISEGELAQWLFDGGISTNREFISFNLSGVGEYSVNYTPQLSTTDGYFIGLTATDIWDIIKLDNFYLIDLTTLGITLSNLVLDYYYDLYFALYNNINLDTFFIQGSAVGYGNGLEDYHNGIYNYLDPTTGVPYNDGYDSGFVDGGVIGYNNGYNEGYDDGFDEGVVSEVDTQWLLGFVTGTVNVLGVSIIPGISLGVFVFIPLFLGFIGFIFRLGGRRG